MNQEAVSISVVIPVYRAERMVATLCDRLRASLEPLGRTYEIVLVDDRSPDRSWEAMRRAAAADPRIVCVRLSRNFGQHYAITAGMDLARGEWVVLMDCDLQDQPEEIPRLLAKADEGYDIVLARRTGRRDPLHIRVLSAIFYSLFNFLSGQRLDRTVGAFRVMHRRVVDSFGQMRENARMVAGMIEWLGFETAAVDVQHAARLEGKSSYRGLGRLRLAMDGILSFSTRPLQITLATGFVLVLLAVAGGLAYLLPGGEPWIARAAFEALLAGLVLCGVGTVGLYVARIHEQTKGRPLYVVDRVVRGGAAKGGA